MSTKSIPNSTTTSTKPGLKHTGLTSNLPRSQASSSTSLHSSASEAQSGSTVRTNPTLRRSQSSNEILTENIDDFALGDKVWVNGQRPGRIRYLGDTQFAPGKWAGIELEADEGKNDGSVAGVRYFECKNKSGVFVRPQRLTRQRIEDPPKSSNKSPTSTGSTPVVTPTNGNGDKTILNTSVSSNKTNGSGNGSSTNGSGSGSGSQYSTGRYDHRFNVGDRVLVNASTGTKLGTLRFLGQADFAPGRWAGVELDEPMGKNDGSVAGKRYFKCPDRYGLFAPLNKIGAAPLGALKPSLVKKPPGTPAKRPGTGLSRQRSGGSQESLNSIASSTASSTRPRVRLGVTSLSSSHKGGKTPSAQLTATSSALNDVIKEKEDHISQLLKERDLERGEVARAATQADQLEEKLTALQSEHQKLVQEADDEIQELKRLNQEYEEMQSKLNAQLDDERKKLEDLQFRLEEETITRTELESNVETLKAEMETIRQQMKSDAELLTKSDSEVVDALRERLREADQRRESEVFGLQEEVVRKEESVLQLEASVEKRNTELANCQKRLLELEQELDSTRQRTDRQIESIDELNMRITREETAKQELSDECKQLSAQLTDTEKRLQNLEDKLRAAADGKHELESVLDGKEAAERQLEHSLLETKRKYEKFEAEVHSLERELQQIRCECDDESRRRRDAEDKCAVLSSMNHTLDLKCEELLRTSGANSDLLLKVNTEVMDKQREFQQREKQWKQELEVKRRENEARSDELRVQSIELEDRKSLLDRTERKLADMEAELKHMDQELKLARSDCDEKDQTLQELRHQVSDLRQKLTAEARDQEMTKGDLEYKLQDMEKELAVKSQELSGQKQEHRDLKDQKFELELERDKYRRDADRLEKACADKQDTVDALREDMKRMSDEFAEHRVAIEQQLTESSATGSALKELGQEIEKQREACREVEDENQSLKDDNRHLRQKVEELRDDIEALDKRHREVLQEFEYECERLAGKAETAAALAEDRAHRLRDVEEQQGVAIDQFRRQAELEKRALEATLNELEVKVRESIAANAEATRRRLQEADNEAGVGAAAAADSYEQQIEFLNSVIVDMQKKNDELRCRVQVLEEIGLDEFDFSNVFNNPASGNGNNGHNNGHQSGGRPTGTNGHIRAPRKFCDICDVFDTHETEDCPQQSSAAAIISEALSGHTYYRASRSEHRPFCLQCERFGHNTEHCPDAETF